MRIPSGVTDQYIYFVAVDSTDFTTRETGLSSFTVYRSRNGGAAAAMASPTVNETDATNMPGVYELRLDEDMTIGSGNDSEEMVFHITATGMAPVTRTIELYRPKITAGNTLGVESDGDLTKVNTLDGHTAQTGDSYARLGTPAGASIAADIGTVDTEVGNIQTDLANGTDGLGAIKTAVDAIPTSNPTAADIADAVWDEAQADHTTGTSFGGLAAEIATIDTEVGNIQTDLDNGTDGLGAIKTAVDAIPTSNPTAAAIADAVWDEDIVAAHGTADTAGKIINDGQTAWATYAGDGSGFSAIPWNASWDAEVQSECTDALNAYDPPTKAEMDTAVGTAQTGDTYGLLTGAHTEPIGVPSANETILDKIGYLFMALRNKVTVTSAKKTFYSDADVAVFEKDLTDAAGTYTETESNTP